MFSLLTLKVFRVFFTKFSIWNTPFLWNEETEELEITTGKRQWLRWKLTSTIQLIYSLFIYVRFYQSYRENGASLNDLIFLTPQFGTSIISVVSGITVHRQSLDMVYTFNQMLKNNRLFGKHTVLKEWDVLAFVLAYLLVVVTMFPVLYAGIFILNPTGPIHSSTQSLTSQLALIFWTHSSLRPAYSLSFGMRFVQPAQMYLSCTVSFPTLPTQGTGYSRRTMEIV